MNNSLPKNYLIEAILVTIFCCQPFGIVSIVYASQVNSKIQSGDIDGARYASDNARKWIKWSVISGVIIGVGVLLLYSTMIVAFLSTNSF